MIDLVAGARPNFMKLAPVVRALASDGRLRARIVHTGQHYDSGMNEVFFSELGIPEPEVHLEVGSGSHGRQTARILERYEEHVFRSAPAATVVFGDVNSTIACALAAVKQGVPVVHVEAGLRSFDRTMPEEINRILTDAIAGLLLVSEPSGVENLEREGIAGDRVRLVGNVMIDTLVAELGKANGEILGRLGLGERGYGLLTLHRPSNVDNPHTLERLLRTFGVLGGQLPIVFPVHPRTRNAAEEAGIAALLDDAPGICALPPISYRDNLALMRSARVVLTDSGGMQEETTFLRVPCITLRENTERPVTTTLGTSRLVGNDTTKIAAAFADVMRGDWPAGQDIPLWDGHAAERVAAVLGEWLQR